MSLVSVPITAMTFGGDKFVAITDIHPNGGWYRAMVSADGGRTWASRELPRGELSERTISGLAYGNGRFVATQPGLPGAFTSSDGETWQEHYPGIEGVFPTALAFGNGTFVAVGGGAAVSTNGVDWTRSDGFSPYPGPQPANDIAFGDGVFVAVSEGSDSCVSTTEDGLTWTPSSTIPTRGAGLSSVAFGNDVFVAPVSFGMESVVDTGRVAVSQDRGVTWDLIDLPFSTIGCGDVGGEWRARIAFGGELFVLHSSCEDHHVYLTRDGRHWWTREVPRAPRQDFDGYSVQMWPLTAYGDGAFVSAFTSDLFLRSSACVGLAEYAEGHYVRVA